jgi:polysaccharide export outer membrane protein
VAGWSLCLALGFLVWPVQSSAGQAAQQKAGAPQKNEAAAVQVPPEYLIGFGDDLHLFVWKEGELTRDVSVRVDGRITVPLLGDLVAIGKTPMGLGREIGTALGRFVENPLVTIIVNKATAARFFIIGEV